MNTSIKRKTKRKSKRNSQSFLLHIHYLAACLAIAHLTERRKRASLDRAIASRNHVSRILVRVCSFFQSMGIAFDKRGVPRQPRIDLSPHGMRRWKQLPELAYQKACEAIGTALEADPGEEDYEQNYASQACARLYNQSLKLESNPKPQMEDINGEMVPVIVRSFRCDARTGRPLGPHIDAFTGDNW